MDSDPELAGKKETEAFRTPEEVAADDESPAPKKTVEIESAAPDNPKKSWKEKMTLHWPPGKKEYITAAVLLVLIGIGAYALLHKPVPATIKPIPKVTPKTKTVQSTLTGLPVDPSVNERTVTGVMIENSLWARPQAGLGNAGVVFEAVAEAGITRFLALYQDTAPKNVGPIRSARPYFLKWALGFDAGYAHVGGSPEALADIKKWRVRDLDEFGAPGSYHRVSSRAAPHNVYTSIHMLNKLEVAKGYKTSKYTGFARKKEARKHRPKPKVPSIRFNISGPDYNVHYSYRAKGNYYFRDEGGAQHTDANNKKHIRPTVVIALIMPYRLEGDGYHSAYSTIGDGPAYIFQDGGVIKGRWHKKGKRSQFVFKDKSGRVIKLNPGYTWLTALPNKDRINYKP